MKLNSVPNNPLYANPKVARARKLIPKDVQNVQKAQQGAAQPARVPGNNPSKAAFSAQAEKILNAKEKSAIQKQFPNTSAEPIAYSRRGKMTVRNVTLGQKIDRKG